MWQDSDTDRPDLDHARRWLPSPEGYFRNGHVLTSGDPDEIEDAVSRVLAPHRLGGDFELHGIRSRLNSITLGDITVGYLTYGRAVSLDIPGDALTAYHVDIPVAGRAQTIYRDGSVSATPAVGAFYSPGQPARIHWEEGCAQICIKYSISALEGELETLLDRPIRRPIIFDRSVNVGTVDGTRWLDTIMLMDRSADLLAHPVMAKRLESLLVDGLLFGHRHNYSDELRNSGPGGRPKAVQQVIDYIEADPAEPMSVGDLAKISGLSVRALQLSFQRSLGMSPMAYLRDVRLARAREQLLRAPSGSMTVTRVAHDWGFLNPGRFTAQYRQKYGESPSETLRGG
ncbi:UNVERIFIED_ORG: Transcriptional regulator containing an amidase domain and an AraC-type DNA-binding HTH domain [Gordonia westfalica J30]